MDKKYSSFLVKKFEQIIHVIDLGYDGSDFALNIKISLSELRN